MAAPKRSWIAKSLSQPRGLHLGEPIHLAKQLGALAREAPPDGLVLLAQVLFCLRLVPPTFGPGQGLLAAAQPHLAAEQGWLQFGDFFRGWASYAA